MVRSLVTLTALSVLVGCGGVGKVGGVQPSGVKTLTLANSNENHFDERGELWSAAGQLLAESRQLALLIDRPAWRNRQPRRPGAHRLLEAARPSLAASRPSP